MSDYLFKGLIKCLDCGKNFRGKSFRDVPSYICSGNSNYGNEFCKRFVVKESEIIQLINSHFKGEEKWRDDIDLYIEEIRIKFGQIEIKYSDGSESILNDKKYII